MYTFTKVNDRRNPTVVTRDKWGRIKHNDIIWASSWRHQSAAVPCVPGARYAPQLYAILLLLARIMGQYRIACCRLSASSAICSRL